MAALTRQMKFKPEYTQAVAYYKDVVFTCHDTDLVPEGIRKDMNSNPIPVEALYKWIWNRECRVAQVPLSMLEEVE